jgi:hypothetical protein
VSLDPIPHDRAVVDRIVDNRHATLLRGPDEVELIVAAASLPADATEGTWLVLNRVDTEWRVIDTDHQMTSERRRDLEGRLDQIRANRRGDRFSR